VSVPTPTPLVVFWLSSSATNLLACAAAARELEDEERALRYAVAARALADQAVRVAGTIHLPPNGETDNGGQQTT
jgi:hypothetical protein